MKNLLLGIRRDWKGFLLALLFGYTTLWSILKPLLEMSGLSIIGWGYFGIFVGTALVIAILKTMPKDSISIHLKNTNTTVRVFFGDIFASSHNIAIGVNEFFDSEIGPPVSEKSIHGQLITKILGGKSDLFDTDVSNSLADESFTEVPRPKGKTRKYPIGTTATLSFGEKTYLLFALSVTDKDYMAKATPDSLLKALLGMLEKARQVCNGFALSIPLVGGGLSRTGMSGMKLLEAILISILYETKKNEITKEIEVVIHPTMKDEIDLKHVEKYWR